MIKMRSYRFLPCLALILPLSVQGADQEGWTESLKREMVAGCVTSLKDAVSADVRTELGLGASEALPPETQQVLNTEFVPEFEKACDCTIDRVAEQHRYDAVANNPDLLREEAARVGTPEGCPLELPGAAGGQ